ncbi:MAG: response regulator [Deltaproteobacteria bacterium]|nr:response regulator [Deltaproteobacteria bacterium]
MGGDSSTGPARAKLRVLVIDDEALIGKAIARTLTAYAIASETRGSGAIERLARGERFDVILLDLLMPDLSGMEVYAEVEKRWPELVRGVVVMTAAPVRPELKSFLDRIPNLWLRKPFSSKELEAAVETASTR